MASNKESPLARPRIESLDEYEVRISDEIRSYLKEMYAKHYLAQTDFYDMTTNSMKEEGQATNQTGLAYEMAEAHLARFQQNMKQPPRQTVLRRTLWKSYNQRRGDERDDSVVERLRDIMAEWVQQSGAADYIAPHVRVDDTLEEVITVDLVSKRCHDSEEPASLFRRCTPDPNRFPRIFTDWPTREKEQGWPMTHRSVVVDRLCGEAVLRGADIFVRGILVADAGIRSGEALAVYAHVGKESISRGMVLPLYSGHCVFLGMGTSCCDRAFFFSQSTGTGILMSALPWERAGPVLPPLNTMMEEGLYAQNLPSVLVGRILDPKPGDIIYDMCGAPGGKTSHLALLTNGQATIVTSDKSRSKVIAARSLFDKLGCSNSIYPLHIDATKCVQYDISVQTDVHTMLLEAKRSETDGLLQVSSFPPESFDKILLDPPCSALGLRPKLSIPQNRVKELLSFTEYQKRFIRTAVSLLRPQGVMTYSTCSTNALENESNVRYILDEFDFMELVPIHVDVGAPGLAGYGLDHRERHCCLRFDSFEENKGHTGTDDLMGFFIAKFRKTKPGISSLDREQQTS